MELQNHRVRGKKKLLQEQRYKNVREMIDRKLASIKGGGVTESDVKRWTEEMREARRALGSTSSNIIQMEEKQFQKRRKKLAAKALGNITYEHNERPGQ